MKTRSKDSQLHIVILLLLLVTIAAYLQVLRADFVNYDDDRYVTENPHVQSGLTAEGFKWAFNIGYEGNWTPLTWISHMLVRQIFGPGPAGPHAVNLLMHVANTLLLLLVLYRMTRSLWKSAFVAALFAVHPMNVESVAWVAERKDVLSTLFWLLTMWAYVRYSEVPNSKRFAVMLVFFALGLMSKPTLMTLPFVLLLLDYWPLGRWADAPRHERWRLVRQKLPLFAMSLASSVVAYLAQQRGGAIRTVAELPLSSRITNALTAYVSYVAKMFWPAKLAVFYPHPGDTPIWHVLAAVVILAAVTALAIRSARSHPYLIVGWLWYLAVLVPMIGLVQFGSQVMSDRFTYVPFIGLFIMIAWRLSESMGVRRHGRMGVGHAHTSLLTAVSLAMVVVLAVCTWRQTGYWRDSVTFWKHTLAVTTGNYTAHFNLGRAYGKLGRYPEEVAEYKQTIRINPNYIKAHNNLGIAYGKLGRYPEEVAEYKQAIRINPDYAMAHFNLGIAYGKLGRYAEAADEYKQTIRTTPDYPDAHYNLGTAYGKLGRYVEEIAEYKQAIRISPDYPDAHYNLGVAYSRLGRYAMAIDAFKQAIRINPDHTNAQYNLGIVYGKLGRYAEAVDAYKQAVRISPDDAHAYYNLGYACGVLGRFAEAVDAYKQTIRINPDYAEAHYNLGNAYGQLGRYAEAVDAFKQAIRIAPDDVSAHLNLGFASVLLGNRTQALDEYKILKRLDPARANRLFDNIYK